MGCMINVKEAVKVATAYFAELFPNAKEVRLEEVEMAEEGPWWDVTVSFEIPAATAMEAILAQRNREYKIIKVNRDSGEPHSIKIRKL